MRKCLLCILTVRPYFCLLELSNFDFLTVFSRDKQVLFSSLTVYLLHIVTIASRRLPQLNPQQVAHMPYLGETSHVAADHIWMRTFEFLDDSETLVQLSEDVSDRTREQGVWRGVLELHTKHRGTVSAHRTAPFFCSLESNPYSSIWQFQKTCIPKRGT